MTQKEIEELRKEPMAQILSSISGIPIDDLIKEFEKEMQEKSKCTKDEVIPDYETTDPLDVAEFKQLVYLVTDLYHEMDKFTSLGIDVWNSIVGIKLVQLLGNLIEYLYDFDFANMFMSEILEQDKDPDQIAYDLIDYLNTRND